MVFRPRPLVDPAGIRKIIDFQFNPEAFDFNGKAMVFRSPASRRLGLERPGLQKSSISFKFLLKIDDFRRRVDSEKPGIEKSPIY